MPRPKFRSMKWPVIVLPVCLVALVGSPCPAQTPSDAAAKPRADSSARGRSSGNLTPSRFSPQQEAMLADTTLKAACTTPGQGLAAGLLVVTFDPRTMPAARAAVAKSVHGTLLPRPGAADAEYYVQVPGHSGDSQQLQIVADQLIRLNEVRSVGSTRCPPAPVPAAPVRADSMTRTGSTRPDSTARPESTTRVDSTAAAGSPR
jgi:hypothetical protein